MAHVTRTRVASARQADCNRPSNPIEIAIGWSLAVCVHPFTAWRVFSRRGRFLITLGYFTVGYVFVLAGLLLAAGTTSR